MNSLLQQKKNILAILFLLLIAGLSNAQQDSAAPKKYQVRNIAWFLPSGADEINGLVISLQVINVDKPSLKINGVNVGAGAVGMFAFPYVLAGHLGGKKSNNRFNMQEAEQPEAVINGLSVSMGGEISVSINGINLAGLSTTACTISGLSLTGGFSAIHTFTGVAISGISNIVIKGRGLQIGLFNNCKDLKGLQIGLWNKSGKRSLPFINWGV